MDAKELEALKASMAATWSPAVCIGREHVLDLIAAAEREAKLRAVLEFVDEKIGHFAKTPPNDQLWLVSLLGELARKVKEALTENAG